MDRRSLFAVLAAVLLAPGLLAAGLLAAGGPAPARADAQASVTIDNFAFTPAAITVAPGTKVTWTNRDDIPHVVADDEHPREVRSPALDTDDTYSRVFAKPGTYKYFCALHPHMQGTVVVR